MSGRRILITGGAGFVGFHLAERLASEGDDLLLVDNLVRGRKDEELEGLLKRPNVRLELGDLNDPSLFERIGKGYDEVYHLAAIIGVQNVLERPHHVVRTNAISTLNLLDWYVAGGGDRLLFSSTSEAYAWTQKVLPLPIPTPEAVPLALTDLKDARSSYAGSKIFCELAITQICQMHDKHFAIVRYHNVYGPRMGHEHVIPQLCKRALATHGPLTVYSVDHQRAFCYVSDAVDATILALRSPGAARRTVNIGNERTETTMGALAKKILRELGRGEEIVPAPASNDPIARRCPDVTFARSLGFQPSVDLDAGLRRTLAWYRPRYESA